MAVIYTKNEPSKTKYSTVDTSEYRFGKIEDNINNINDDIKNIEDAIKSNLDIQNKDIDFLKKRSDDAMNSIENTNEYIYEVHGLVNEDINKTEEKLLKKIKYLVICLIILFGMCAFSIGASLSLVL